MKPNIKLRFAAAAFFMPAMVSTAPAANITLQASDGFGASSFNSGASWTGAAAPTSGNDYFTGDFILRTPANTASHIFAGDSLTINNTNGYPQGLFYKGSGTTATITIGNLILNGGMISHGNGASDVFNLAGAINVASNSSIYAKQGDINVLSSISGSATITNPGADIAGNVLTFLSTTSTFTGSLVNNGSFVLADNAVFNFSIGASGVNNSITGAGLTTLNGEFIFDLSGASTGVGDSWNLVSGGNFGSSFSVSGFTNNGNDTWTSGNYVFDESNGILAVVPEPSVALLGGLSLMALIRRRR